MVPFRSGASVESRIGGGQWKTPAPARRGGMRVIALGQPEVPAQFEAPSKTETGPPEIPPAHEWSERGPGRGGVAAMNVNGGVGPDSEGRSAPHRNAGNPPENDHPGSKWVACARQTRPRPPAEAAALPHATVLRQMPARPFDLALGFRSGDGCWRPTEVHRGLGSQFASVRTGSSPPATIALAGDFHPDRGPARGHRDSPAGGTR